MSPHERSPGQEKGKTELWAERIRNFFLFRAALVFGAETGIINTAVILNWTVGIANALVEFVFNPAWVVPSLVIAGGAEVVRFIEKRKRQNQVSQPAVAAAGGAHH